MAKIRVCDICLKEGKLTKTDRYMSVKGHKDLTIDYCQKCKSKIPKDVKKYIKFVYDLRGVLVDDEFCKKYVREF